MKGMARSTGVELEPPKLIEGWKSIAHATGRCETWCRKMARLPEDDARRLPVKYLGATPVVRLEAMLRWRADGAGMAAESTMARARSVG